MKKLQLTVKVLPLATILAVFIAALVSRALVAEGRQEMDVFLPLVVKPVEPSPTPTPPPANVEQYVNVYRQTAGSPPVSFNATLNDNCWQHARYMAENNHLTHNQNPDLPYASPAGQICAQKGNAWIGYGSSWTPFHTIDGWMRSVGHRLWLLYPTTPTVGYGFYTINAGNRSAAALDVLSTASFGADTGYPHWPVRYPAPGQSGVPATTFPVTLNWRYFGSTPTLTSVSWTTAGGSPIPHAANTSLPVNHKGIQIIPTNALPNNTLFTISVQGSYDGVLFNYTWQFATGSAPANE